MRGLFDPDNPLMNFITKMAYSAYLNILWLICCLPVVTAGASTTALFYVTLKMAEDREEGITGMFFRAFRQNFKAATKVWLILLAVGAFLLVDAWVMLRIWNQSVFWTLIAALLIVAAIAYAIVLMYAFPLVARFDNTTWGILKVSLLIGLRYLICTILMAAIYVAMGWLVIFVFTPAFLLGFGCCAMLCSYLLVNVIHACGGDPDAQDSAEEAAGDEPGGEGQP